MNKPNLSTVAANAVASKPQRVKRPKYQGQAFNSFPEHSNWRGMKDRCRNPNSTSWNCYGGRGITVCAGLLNFQTFMDIMGRRPYPSASIERPNTNGNYTCGSCAECKANSWRRNVKWADDKEQSNNKRNNHRVTSNGVTRTVMQWSEHTGLHRTVIQNRIRRGWSEHDAVTVPVHRQRRYTRPMIKRSTKFVTWKGETRTITEWAKITGKSYFTLFNRVEKGWSPEKIFSDGRKKPVAEWLEYNGERKKVIDWAAIIGITPVAIRWRLSHGWTLEQVMSKVKHKHLVNRGK